MVHHSEHESGEPDGMSDQADHQRLLTVAHPLAAIANDMARSWKNFAKYFNERFQG